VKHTVLYTFATFNLNIRRQVNQFKTMTGWSLTWDWAPQNGQCHKSLCSKDIVCSKVNSLVVKYTLSVKVLQAAHSFTIWPLSKMTCYRFDSHNTTVSKTMAFLVPSQPMWFCGWQSLYPDTQQCSSRGKWNRTVKLYQTLWVLCHRNNLTFTIPGDELHFYKHNNILHKHGWCFIKIHLFH